MCWVDKVVGSVRIAKKNPLNVSIINLAIVVKHGRGEMQINKKQKKDNFQFF